MKSYRLALPAALFCLAKAGIAAAEAPRVVASIKPVHSLVAGVMAGVGEPGLIVDGAASPHSYSLKPSDAGELEHAALVFWIGPSFEAFLAAPLETLAKDAKVVTLGEAEGLQTLDFREGGPFEAHDHEAEEGGGDTHEEDHGGVDMHLWLDPQNAGAMVGAIKAALASADPVNAAAYEANADDLLKRIDALEDEIAATLAPVSTRPYVVFHDAYQYFERRFATNAVGSVTVSPEVAPGAQRIAEMQATVRELGAACVFSEPQFEPGLAHVVAEGSSARSGVLDPLGAGAAKGTDQYFVLMRELAKSLKDCLSGPA